MTFCSHFSKTRFWLVANIGIVLSIFFAMGADTAADTQFPKGIFDVRDYGAAGDGVTLDTKAIQAAVDACTRAGGGKVYLHNGTFLSGTIYLKSDVTLYLEAGAVLLGSTNIRDYPDKIPAYRSRSDDYTRKSIIYAERAENIAILGRGVIDGQGENASFKGREKDRPLILRFVECKNVEVKDITLRNSAMWVQSYLACENVTIDGISVHSKVNANNDGIDIDDCENVRISNCEISTSDDALCLKSTSGRGCKNITITNCVLSSSNASALKFGTDSSGGFENITVDNCTIYDTSLSGIALELVDGGSFDRVNISNITMKNVGVAIFIRLGNRARPYPGMEKPGMGSMRNIMISNVQATGVGSSRWHGIKWGSVGCAIAGLPNFPIENVTLENIRIQFKGGGTQEDAVREIPERAEAYPMCMMFGTLPAYGFYVRHAKNVKFHNLDLGFEKDDHRPALVFDDVSDLDIFDLYAESTPSAQALIWLKQVDGAFIQGCRPRNTVATFVRVDGNKSNNITLMNNDLSRVEQILKKGKETKENAVYLNNNRTK